MDIINVAIPYKFENIKKSTYADYSAHRDEFNKNVEQKVIDAFFEVYEEYVEKYGDVGRQPIFVNPNVSNWSFDIHKKENVKTRSFSQTYTQGETLAVVNISLVSE